MDSSTDYGCLIFACQNKLYILPPDKVFTILNEININDAICMEMAGEIRFLKIVANRIFIMIEVGGSEVELFSMPMQTVLVGRALDKKIMNLSKNNNVEIRQLEVSFDGKVAAVTFFNTLTQKSHLVLLNLDNGDEMPNKIDSINSAIWLTETELLVAKDVFVD